LTKGSAAPPAPRVAAHPYTVLSGRHAVAVITHVVGGALEVPVVHIAIFYLTVGRTGQHGTADLYKNT